MKATQQLRSDCPINYMVELLGDKWSLLIVRDILLAGKNFYGDFLASEEKIATNILSSRLVSLEEKGIITKKKDPENGTKFIYSLTPKGVALTPIFVEMMLWSAKYHAVPPERAAVVYRAKTDKSRLILEIQQSLSGSAKQVF
jgi:DNA-binding HxlR family transcriptional regulator